jgi:hypothetical protein
MAVRITTNARMRRLGFVLCGKPHIVTKAKRIHSEWMAYARQKVKINTPATQCNITSTRRWVNNAFFNIFNYVQNQTDLGLYRAAHNRGCSRRCTFELRCILQAPSENFLSATHEPRKARPLPSPYTL